jgi:methionyl-tRNA synthetase
MSNKCFDDIVESTGVEDEIDKNLKDLATGLNTKVTKHMDEFRISEAIDDVFELLRASNKYIDETMPWALAKEEDKKDRLKEVLYNLIESIRVCAVYLQAFLPETADKIFYQINTDIKSYESTKEFGKYVSGTKVNNPEILFARIDTTK